MTKFQQGHHGARSKIYANKKKEKKGKQLDDADYTKLYGKMGNNNDIGNLRKDLHELHKWSEDWQMFIIIDKGKILHEKKVVIELYQSLVCPHLDYSIQSWRPYLLKDIAAHEKCNTRQQKSFQRYINVYFSRFISVYFKMRIREYFTRCINVYFQGIKCVLPKVNSNVKSDGAVRRKIRDIERDGEDAAEKEREKKKKEEKEKGGNEKKDEKEKSENEKEEKKEKSGNEKNEKKEESGNENKEEKRGNMSRKCYS
ncbi:uncharacterized protein [Procambarus clarkii]|uniref:uncharacterized protein n=1 Tax=Procambarus clarkii TaxID=6728 RepID=UPI00374276DD